MKVANALALALTAAAGNALAQQGKNAPWMARAVAEKLDRNPEAGLHSVKDINVHCRAGTRNYIAATQRVDVWK